jgi:hypothetical protein
MSTSPLWIDVYVAPMRSYTCPDPLGEGEVATWAPSSSTLISGPTEGILIDALLTGSRLQRGFLVEALQGVRPKLPVARRLLS